MKTKVANLSFCLNLIIFYFLLLQWNNLHCNYEGKLISVFMYRSCSLCTVWAGYCVAHDHELYKH